MRQVDFFEQRLGAVVAANSRLELSVEVDVVGLYLCLRNVVGRRPRHEDTARQLPLQPQLTRKPDLYRSRTRNIV